MATYSFTAVLGTTLAFNPATDVLSFAGNASGFRLTQSGNDLIVTAVTGGSVTLTNMQLAQVTTTNFSLADTSDIIVGDNTTGTTNDALSQSSGGALDLVAANGANLDANNLIYGMAEGDTLTVGNGNNVIYGGSAQSDTADGSDYIVINGSTGTSGNNEIYANAGNDTVLFTRPTGTGKTALVYGGLGNDNVLTGAAAGFVTLYGNAGRDTLDASSATGSVTIFGGNGGVDTTDDADVLTSGLGSTVLYGNAGNDQIFFDDFVLGTNQTLYGGLGDDYIAGDAGGTGSAGALTAFGNAGNDVFDLTTHVGSATVYGGNAVADSADGNDSFTIGTANTLGRLTLYANGGNDTITSTAALAAGETILAYLGFGVDVVNISGSRSATSSLTINPGAGNDSISVNDTALTGDATVTIEGFESTDIFNVTLSGGSATTLQVTGTGANLSINNSAGHGNYVFSGYTGGLTGTNFKISDGSVLYVNAGSTAAAVTGSANNDQLIAGLGGDSLSGGAGNDIITGGDGADSLTGGDGVDTIVGGAGNDTILANDGGALGGGADSSLDGGEGSDSVTGGLLEDSIVGGLGNDTLNGAAGTDTLTGGTGNDTFAFTNTHVTAVLAEADVVTDAFDQIDVVDIDTLTNATLRGTGTVFSLGDASQAQALGANVGLYVATNTVADFTEASIYSVLNGIADDLAASDIFYLMVSDGVDSMLVRITEAANIGTLAAVDDTLDYVARFNGINATELAALTEGNFSDFA